MSVGFKISKPGTDVSSSDVLDFALSTDYPVFKTKEQGEATITLESADTTKTYTITHNLGYRAETWIFIEDDPGSGRRRKVTCFLGGSATVATATYNTNDTTLTVIDPNTGSERVYSFYYYVFYDPKT